MACTKRNALERHPRPPPTSHLPTFYSHSFLVINHTTNRPLKAARGLSWIERSRSAEIAKEMAGELPENQKCEVLKGNEEVIAAARTLFGAYDSDGDGRVDLEQFQALNAKVAGIFGVDFRYPHSLLGST